MRRLPLSTILIAINVGVLLLAVTGVAIVAVQLLQHLADDQALARVAQAGTIVRQELNNEHSEVLRSAQLLSERPTLRRLLDENDTARLAAFLQQFAATSQLDGTAVWRDGQPVTTTGQALPWDAIWQARQTDQPRWTVEDSNGHGLIMAAWSLVPSDPNDVVLTVEVLDAALMQQISEDIGLSVSAVARRTAEDDPKADQADLRAQALATNSVVTTRLDMQRSYLAFVPLEAPSGELAGVIEARLPTDAVTRSVQQLIEILLALALGVCVLAAAANFVVGRRLGRPLAKLTGAAARIGSGDLVTPMPTVGGQETATLAATLDEMRMRLLRLTADLKRQRAEAQAILTGINEGVFTVDRARHIRYLNKQTAALLGINESDAIGRFCGDVLHPQGSHGVRPCEEHCPIMHARFRGGARATEHLLLTNGQQRTVVITSAPPTDDQQVQVLRDETETEAVRRLRDTMLANISHEFRTPLSAQLASIELLLDQLPDLSVEQTNDLIYSLQRGTLRLTQLIDNLLESARLEAGQHTIRQRPIALDNVVEEALELTRPLLDQRQQQTHVELPYPLPTICGDATRLTQVFVNLLANANKFAPAGSTIQIGGKVGTSSVMVWVEDCGPGLPTLHGTTLFGQFMRAHADEPEQSGVGLGLWIVKSIVERHGGTIEARSLSTGTRMCVTLPIERAVHEHRQE